MKNAIYCVSILLLTSFLLYSQDNQPPSSNPPGNLKPEQVPLFVSIGWDDNSHSGFTYYLSKDQAIHWLRNFLKPLKNPAGIGNAKTYDGTSVRNSFFNNTVYIEKKDNGDYLQQLKVAWKLCYQEGHEVGNHTHSHIISKDGSNYTVAQWKDEMILCNEWLTKPAPDDTDSISLVVNVDQGAGIPKNEVYGFRAPYLYYNDNAFTAISELGFVYDCSIEDGYQDTMDGTNFLWPYTLDNGSPGHDYLKSSGMLQDKMKHVTIGKHPGLWEMPDHPVIVPPDEECSKYEISPGLRTKIKSMFSYFDVESGKITGLDYNLMYGYRLNKEEALATLKYTLDLRLKGNRAPFLFGAHSQYYSNTSQCIGEPDTKKRMELIEEFIRYALKKPDVRIVPFIKIIEWCRNPVALDNNAIISNKQLQTSQKINALSITANGSIMVPGIIHGAVSIYNPAGKLIAHREIANNRSTEAISLSRGMYVFQIKGDRLSSVQNVMVH